MRWLADLWFRLRALVGRGALERELDEEFRFHLDMEARKLEASGMPAREAKRTARLRFGGEDRFKEETRGAWGVGVFTDLSADLRFAWRQLARSPGFSALATITLALGIGGTVALFSVVWGLMIRPLPFTDEDRLVTFWSDYNWRGEEFDVIRDVPRGFAGVAAYSNDAYTLRTESGSTLVLATVASAEFFDVLGVAPLFGRTFLPGDDRPGSEPVIVLSHALWVREFGADRSVIGRMIDVSGTPRTVVGVMPEEFWFPTPEMQAFIPLDLDPVKPGYANNGWLVLTARLHPSTTDAQVQADLGRITTVLGERYDYPEAWDKTRNAHVVSMREYLLGEVRPVLLLLLSAVGFLLLMACVNVAALILTRTVDRTSEMSVRTVLGAGRWQLARQVLTESVLLGLVAGAVGIALAAGLFGALVASLPIDPAFRSTLRLDGATLVTALAVSIVAGAGIALAPLHNVMRGHLGEGVLSERTPTAGGRRAGRVQRALVAVEVLLAVVLASGASLLVRTVGQLRAIDPGFDPRGVLTMDILVGEEDAPVEARAAFFDALVDRVEALPGVSSAGYTNRLPLRDGGWQGPVRIADRPDLDGANRPNVMYRPLSPGAFDAFGVTVIAGRGILPSDRAGSPPVAVINETFARRIWGDQSSLGRRFTSGFVGEVEVVGVIRDMVATSLTGEQPMVGYYPWDQAMRGEGYGLIVVKTTGRPEALTPTLRTLVKELEPRAAIGRVATMQAVVDGAIAEPLRLRFFLGLFSLLGIVLGTVGVYGVVSHSVQRRRTEFGIRLAVGADPARLLTEVVRAGMRPVLLGAAAGATVSWFTSATLTGFLFGVKPTDPVSLVTAASVLVAAGIVAALVPAWRASRTAPSVSLRAE